MKTEKALIRKLKEHDEEAFDEIYQKYFRLIKHVAYQILPSDMLAEDIVQETFFRMYQNIGSYQYDVSFSAWLCTIAKNLALNEKKKRSHNVPFPEYDTEKFSVAPQTQSTDDILMKVKNLLGEKDYNLVIFRLYHELSYKEISDITGESVAALTNRYHRAVKKLKGAIKL